MLALQIFKNIPEQVNWDRFRSYTQRIRYLSWSDSDVPAQANSTLLAGPISPLLFNDIFAYSPARGSLALLPRLTAIQWTTKHDVNVKQLLFLLPESLNTLDIDFEACNSAVVRSVLQAIPDKSPKVAELRFHTWAGIQTFDEALGSCIRRLTSLRNVTLPRFFGSWKVVAALGDLENLENICQPEMDPLERDDEVHPEGMDWKFPTGSFASLKHLRIDVLLSHAERLARTCGPPSLRTVVLNVMEVATNEALEDFTATLAQFIPAVVEISLNLFFKGDTSGDGILFSALEPLLKCREVEFFGVGHPRSIVLSDDHIVAMGKAWPSLKSLQIFGGSASDSKRQPLTTLNTLAVHCPHLEDLHLAVRIESHGETLVPGPASFERLKHMGFDTSAIAEADITAVAVFLGFILPPKVSITCGKDVWQHEYTNEADIAAEKEHSTRWALAAKGVENFHRMKESRG